MKLTKSYRRTILSRLREDPQFEIDLLREVRRLIRSRAARDILDDIITNRICIQTLKSPLRDWEGQK